MTELDKFKRRLIRTVARLLRQESQPGDAVWEQLQKETGCDCKLLWQRMKALTMKKMKRLMIADDRLDNIATVARMSITDWLLFDLVLVHENFDVIGKDMNKELPALDTLFSLVQRFGIEHLNGDAALEAWMNITREYNNRGRRASPMLLQRRWFQLKEQTRHGFYTLWYSYRGNQRLWDRAAENKPTDLHQAIARRFPHVVTKPFLKWQELIDKRYVILSEEFDNRVRKSNEAEKKDDKPDLVMIEPVIETIDLRAESDDDTAQSKPAHTNASEVSNDPERDDEDSLPPFNLSIVKQEPVEDGLSNVQILEAMHMPADEGASELLDIQIRKVKLVSQIEQFITEDEDTANISNIEDIESVPTPGDQNYDAIDIPDDLIKHKADEYIQSRTLATIKRPEKQNNQDDTMKVPTPGDQNYDDMDIPDDLIKHKADEYIQSKTLATIKRPDKQNNQEDDTMEVPTPGDQNYDDIEIPDDLIKQKADEYIQNKTLATIIRPEKQNNQENDTMEIGNEVDNIIKQKADDFVRKVDIKKLVHDVVDEYKLPSEVESNLSSADEPADSVDGIEIVDEGIEYMEDEDFGEYAVEPKHDGIATETPATAEFKHEKQDEKNDSPKSKESRDSAKIDLKLLMNPVVYTTKLDDMIMFQGKNFDSLDKLELINSVIVESKPVSDKAIKIEPETEVTELKTVPEAEPETQIKPQTEPTLQIELTAQTKSTPQTALIPQTVFIPQTDLTPHTKPTPQTVLAPEIEVIENSTQNDSISVSSEIDEQEDDISEDLKVKPTSYLLKKPKRPTYGPIQLCKNPDFNTRLKRLTAGFFSSARNRHLLSECKPMTIDLHKAFEPKLIDGTLYLKKNMNVNAGTSVEEKETSNSAPVSVLPSAMPVQSLISKHLNLDITDLVSGTTQLDTVDLTKRSKVINLRDLSEIRRINQHLLTAQVPPMRVQNSQPVTPSSILEVDDGSPEVAVNKEVDGEPDQPKIVNVSGGQDMSPRQLGSGPGLEPENEEEKSLLRETTSGRGRGRGRGRGQWRGGPNVGPKLDVGPKLLKSSNSKLYYRPSWQPSTRPVRVTWNKARVRLEPKLDEALLTVDTLNRMINKLHGGEGDYSIKTKKGDVINDTPEPPIDITDECTKVVTPPKESSPPPEPKPKPKLKPGPKRRNKSETYCCWSREKIVKFGTKRRFILLHGCPKICMCCCRLELGQVLNTWKSFSKQKSQEINVKPPVMKDTACQMPVSEAIVLSDDESNFGAECTVGAHDGSCIVPENAPVPKLRVIQEASMQKMKTYAGCSHGNSTCTTVCSGRGLPMNVSGVSATESSVPAPVHLDTADQQPVLRINVSFSPAPPSVPTAPTAAEPQVLNYNFITPNTSPTKMTTDLVPSIKTLKRAIIIDGESAPTTPTKTDHDPVVILNSKNIIRKPKESPIFLGKNKILLTTVKFPPYFRTLPPIVSKPLPPPVLPTVIPALTVPVGVQLVLMANGELTYTLEPGNTLTEEQLSVMPSIISAVQEQINLSQQPGSTVDSNIPVGSEALTEKSVPTDIPLSVSEAIMKSNVTANIQTVQSQDLEMSNAVESISEGNITERYLTTDTEITSNVESQETVQACNVQSEKTTEVGQISNTSLEHSEPTSSLSSSTVSEIINVEETSESTAEVITNVEKEKKSESNSVSTGSRNLLSDLMEMSGISTEDTRPQEIVSQETVIPNAEDNTHMIVRQLASAVGSASTPMVSEITPEVPPPVIPVENTGIAQIQSVTSTAVENVSTELESLTKNDINVLNELTPITSLAELKYACEQNGQFFKLDFDTGVVVPINVSIKKSKPKLKSLGHGCSLAPKSVIDLTEDQEIPTSDPTLTKEPVKPLKLFKSSITCKQPSVLKKYKGTSFNENEKLNPGASRKNPRLRKQRLNTNVNLSDSDTPLTDEYIVQLPDTKENNVTRLRFSNGKWTRKTNKRKHKIEAKIDMVDSDAPMEEEYLVESSDSDSDTKNKTSRNSVKNHVPVEETGEDSSDDEPLAKKFVRIREISLQDDSKKQAEATGNKNDNNVDNAKNNSQILTRAVLNEDTPQKATESQDTTVLPLAPTSATAEGEKDVEESDNINSDEMDLDDSHMVTFLADESESQEDCILGV